MNVEIVCPNGHKVQVAEVHLGIEISCPTCGVAFVASRPGTQAPPAPTETPRQGPTMPQLGEKVAALRSKIPPGVGLKLLSPNTGRPMLMIGLVLVLLARGCDTLGQRSVDRADAKVEIAQNEFADECEDELADIQGRIETTDQRIQDLTEKDDQTQADRDKIQELRKKQTEDRNELTKIQEQHRLERNKLEKGRWRELQSTARDADSQNRAAGYWREMFFVFASVVLAVGLLIVSWSAQGAERWVCLIMLAIITFSIYIGGIAWMAGNSLG